MTAGHGEKEQVERETFIATCRKDLHDVHIAVGCVAWSVENK